MNKTQKESLLAATNALRAAKDMLAEIKDEEEEAFEELSDSAKEGERGERMSNVILTLDYAIDALDTMEDELGVLQ